jgi:hypothetical protein
MSAQAVLCRRAYAIQFRRQFTLPLDARIHRGGWKISTDVSIKELEVTGSNLLARTSGGSEYRGEKQNQSLL